MTRVARAAGRRAVDVFGRRGNEILRGHDPLGLTADGAPDDEYDCVVTGVMVELMGERDSTLEAWISEHFEVHLGTTPDRHGVRDATRALVSLWRSEDVAALRP